MGGSNGALLDAPAYVRAILDEVCDHDRAVAWWRNPLTILDGRSPRDCHLAGDRYALDVALRFVAVPPL